MACFVGPREVDCAAEALAVLQALEGVPKRNAVVELHELDDVARLAARHAMKQPLLRRHNEVGMVVVERAATNPVFAAVVLQLHAPAAHQGQQVRGVLYALKVSFRDSRHGQPPRLKKRRQSSVNVLH